jgi:hypothetical protein
MLPERIHLDRFQRQQQRHLRIRTAQHCRLNAPRIPQ